MKALAARVVLGIGVIAGCLGATYLAATFALQRPDSWRIDAALASRLTADYSSDDYGAQARPPLNPEVVDAARTDEQALGANNGDAAPPASTVEPPATPVPQANDGTPAPRAATNTPVPPTHTATPEPQPTDTPKPEPTQTPVTSPTATPRSVTCGDKESGGLSGGECKTPSATPSNSPVPPTPTVSPTATPRSIVGCLPLLGGDKCNSATSTPTPVPEPDGGDGP